VCVCVCVRVCVCACVHVCMCVSCMFSLTLPNRLGHYSLVWVPSG
jgi:hypothetical protein